MSEVPALAFTLEEIRDYLARVFPQIGPGESVEIEAIAPLSARVRMRHDDRHLRPGGTISGPTIFALADVALYVATLAQVGRYALAVTTNLNLNFLSKAAPGDLIGDATILKLGKRLVVGEVAIRSVGAPRLIAHATGTYSLPSRGDAVS